MNTNFSATFREVTNKNSKMDMDDGGLWIHLR